MVKVTQSSTSSSYLNQVVFPSYDGGCLAVIDKFSVSSVKPDDRPTLHEVHRMHLVWISAENLLRYKN